MAAVTIHSDFEAHKEEICHYFHLFPFYLGLNAMILVVCVCVCVCVCFKKYLV